MATSGTCKEIVETGFECELVHKISEGRPNVEDKLKNGEIQLVINTSDSHTFAGDTKKFVKILSVLKSLILQICVQLLRVQNRLKRYKIKVI